MSIVYSNEYLIELYNALVLIETSLHGDQLNQSIC